MKILNYLLSACIMSSALAGLTGCSEDDPNPNGQDQTTNGGSNDPNAPNTPGTPDANQPVVSNPVTGLCDNDDHRWKFDYSNGKMIGATDEDGFTYKFTTNPFTISAYGEDKSGYEKTVYSNIQLNRKGYITQANYQNEGRETYFDGETDKTYTWKYTATISISYQNDEYISKIIMNGKEEHDGGYRGTDKEEFTFTWNEGNLTSIDEKWYYEDTLDGAGEGTHSTTFNYNGGQKNSGIYLSDFTDDIIEHLFWYAGLLGKPTRLMPVHASIEAINGDDPYSRSYTITSHYNGDGTVSGFTLFHEQDEYEIPVQFFYNGAYPDLNEKATYQLNKAIKNPFERKHTTRRAAQRAARRK